MGRYENNDTKNINIGEIYNGRVGISDTYTTTIYRRNVEKSGDIHVITQQGDRLDLLAEQFYGSSRLWWFLASANGLNTMNVKAGTKLRIPTDSSTAGIVPNLET